MKLYSFWRSLATYRVVPQQFLEAASKEPEIAMWIWRQWTSAWY